MAVKGNKTSTLDPLLAKIYHLLCHTRFLILIGQASGLFILLLKEIPQHWHLGVTSRDKHVSFGDFSTQAARSSSSAPPSQNEAGAGHCTAAPMATASSWGAAHTNCSSTSSCSFNPGLGAVENHRKGKNPSQNPTPVVITNWSLF